jgi:hypothetical protein
MAYGVETTDRSLGHWRTAGVVHGLVARIDADDAASPIVIILLAARIGVIRISHYSANPDIIVRT